MKLMLKQIKTLLHEIEIKEIYSCDTEMFFLHEFDNLHLSFIYNFSTRHVNEFQFYIGEEKHELNEYQYNKLINKLHEVSEKWHAMKNDRLEEFEVNGFTFLN